MQLAILLKLISEDERRRLGGEFGEPSESRDKSTGDESIQ
jgi:hypothetical protein